MRPRGLAFLSFALLSISIFLFNLNGCAGGTSRGDFSHGKIKHVIIVFQENRTPDNLFHDPVLISRGADIATSGVDSQGNTVALTPVSLGVDYDLSHTHAAFVSMFRGGKMNGADKVPVICHGPRCPSPNAQFKYVQASDVGPYFQLAEQYTFGDRMFQTQQGPSFPAHQFIISGTSAPTPASKFFAAENTNNGFEPAGCASPPTTSVAVIGPNGKESSFMYPCFEHPTLTDELNAQKMSWRYYTPSAISIWTGPNAIQHMCGPNGTPPHATDCTGPDWVNHVVLYTKQHPAPILEDIANNTLPDVSWVIPAGQNSDHAGSTLTLGGPSWVAAIVNAIGESAYWSDTAIIITWDDWGGWYDHVKPPIINDGISWGSGYVYGFRVPLIVVSPYARPAYISHKPHDFGSILNVIEEVFGLPSLGYADAYTNDLSDCFDFGQTPLQFKKIPAPLDAQFFLTDQRTPTDPDDD